MNIIENKVLSEEREWLKEIFSNYYENILSIYNECESKICSWEYSLGIKKEIIPYESIIPFCHDRKGKEIKNLTKTTLASKNLVAYGLDDKGDILILKSKYHKDISKFGVNVRMVHNDMILNACLYDSSPEKNRLMSICHMYKKNNYKYYVSVTPPRNWFVRIDRIEKNKILNSSMFATSWFKQIDFDLFYNNGSLSEIKIGDLLHWKTIS